MGSAGLSVGKAGMITRHTLKESLGHSLSFPNDGNTKPCIAVNRCVPGIGSFSPSREIEADNLL